MQLSKRIHKYVEEGVSEVEEVVNSLKIRLSEDLIPEWKERQELQIPYEEDLSYDRHIVGFGHYKSLEWYFIFSDGERSQCRT